MMMSKLTEDKIGSTIHEKLQAARMSDAERKVALQAMQDAELIVDAILWTTRKIEQLGARLFLKPSLRH
jgi:hypothetical protein